MIREILGIALITVGFISIVAHIIATGRRAARHTYDTVPSRATGLHKTSRTREARRGERH